MAAKRTSATAESKKVFGRRQAPAGMFRAGLYVRVSTHDQKALPLQMRTMREYAAKRNWEIAVQIKEVGSGAVERELREKLIAAARRREIDVVLVWRLDRWGRSLADLVVTVKELAELGVGLGRTGLGGISRLHRRSRCTCRSVCSVAISWRDRLFRGSLAQPSAGTAAPHCVVYSRTRQPHPCQ